MLHKLWERDKKQSKRLDLRDFVCSLLVAVLSATGVDVWCVGCLHSQHCTAYLFILMIATKWRRSPDCRLPAIKSQSEETRYGTAAGGAPAGGAEPAGQLQPGPGRRRVQTVAQTDCRPRPRLPPPPPPHPRPAAAAPLPSQARQLRSTNKIMCIFYEWSRQTWPPFWSFCGWQRCTGRRLWRASSLTVTCESGAEHLTAINKLGAEHLAAITRLGLHYW